MNKQSCYLIGQYYFSDITEVFVFKINETKQKYISGKFKNLGSAYPQSTKLASHL